VTRLGTKTFAGLKSTGATRVVIPIAVRRAKRLLAASFIALQVAATLHPANAQQRMPSCAVAGSYLASAQKALAAGDSATALARLNRAIEVDSKCADAYLLLGLTEFQRGETAKSIQHYKQALKLVPRSYSGHYDLALAYLQEKNLREARNELEQAVALDPKQANAAYDLGIVLLEMEQPASALPHLHRAHAINPDRPDVSFNIVRAELDAGSPAEARQAAQDEGSHLGSDFQWNAAIGQLFLKHAQPGDAALYFRAANLIRPGDEDVRYQLATAYLASRQPENVLDLIKEPKTADEHYLRGSAFYQAHRFADADEESDAALALAPENPKALVLRVRLLQRAGQQNAALEMAQKATVLAPYWDEPFYLAGISYYFIRHYTQARQSLARAFELNPSSATAVFMEALAWANEGKPQEAERYLQRAISLQSDNARFHCHLGILLLRENHYAKAEESFKKAIQLKPEYALSHYELGKLQASSKQWKEARQELEEAITLDPGLTSAYYQLARVYASLGEAEKSEHMLAEFKRLRQQETDDSVVADEDARKESDPR
jgi:tetratricopeptide (TPR) repeat protein